MTNRRISVVITPRPVAMRNFSSSDSVAHCTDCRIQFPTVPRARQNPVNSKSVSTARASAISYAADRAETGSRGERIDAYRATSCPIQMRNKTIIIAGRYSVGTSTLSRCLCDPHTHSMSAETAEKVLCSVATTTRSRQDGLECRGIEGQNAWLLLEVFRDFGDQPTSILIWHLLHVTVILGCALPRSRRGFECGTKD